MKYQEITDDIADKFDEHLDRLITIMHVQKLFSYCFEQDIYSENKLEYCYLNKMLCSYVDDTKTQFCLLENSLNIPN